MRLCKIINLFYMSEGRQNPEFLKDKYDLHNALEVGSAAKRTEARTKETLSKKPADQIQNYLDRLSEIVDRTNPHLRERGLEAAKEILHNKFVIKPENIPESYFDNQRRIAREQGHGDIEITQEMRSQLTEVIITDQESSLDKWVDYLASPDATYPDWLKYYAIRSVLGIGEYDKKKKEFTKRSKGTVKPFPDLNREALAYVLDAIEKKYSDNGFDFSQLKPEDQKELEKLLQGENFAKLYAWAIEKVTPTEVNQLTITNGEWIKYNKGSDHMPLVKSLQGHGTGWCTAGESTAQKQLEGGDFYVYYSYDKDGKPTIPRVAIRMQDNTISEVRGIAPEQNLDPFIGPVVQEKLTRFPDGRLYEKKVSDMKRLTDISKREEQNGGLTVEDLRFLYEIDGQIQGFGYQKDPRIKELKAGRNAKQDLAQIFDCSEKEISTTEDEAFRGSIKFHYGGLSLTDLTSAEGLKLPEMVYGYLKLSDLTSAEGLKLPETVGGSLNLNSLTSAKGLKLPKTVGSHLRLNNLTSAEGLKLPETVGGDLDLNGLTSAEGLKLPETVGGDLNLRRLTSAEGLKLPETVGGYLNLSGLTSAEGLKLPETVGGHLDLSGLTSAQGLKLPETLGGGLYLHRLTSVRGLKLPETISSDLNLEGLTSAEGLKLPESVGGNLDLSHLTSAKDLKLPESVGGDLSLRGLTSAEWDKLRKTYPKLRIV